LSFRGTDYNIGIAGQAGDYSTWSAQNDMIIRTLTGSKLILQSGNLGGCICINSGNNVGIGTNNPNNKLDVRGVIQSENLYIVDNLLYVLINF
jgi:hypothetical protein